MEKEKKPFDKKKFFNILSYVGVSVFFLFALICAIAKFNGAKFALFGRRYDVVLTNSMSEKSEKYKSFLEGHDDQFKAFDLAVSKKIKSPEDLHVYDVVIYKDRTIGTNMHRIVGIEEDGHDEIRYLNSNVLTLGDKTGICLTDVDSKVEFNDIAFQELELQVYTENLEEEKHYNFSILDTAFTPTITYENSGSGKIVTYRVSKDSLGVGLMKISHSKYFDFSKEVILSLNVKSTAGEINSSHENVSSDGSNLVGLYNQIYKYEIRGDKAENSDGYYHFDELEAKVIRNIKNGGYLIRFLNSIWGGVMFLSLGFLIILVQFLSRRAEKKANLAATDGTPTKENKKKDKLKKVKIDKNKEAKPKEEKK